MSKSLQCGIARTDKEREAVYRLRYQCYRGDNSIDACPTQLFRDEIDTDANHFSFLLTEDVNCALATVRVSVVRQDLGWHDSPAMHVFGDHPALRSIASGSLVEASRFCFAAQARRDAFFHLIAKMGAMADFYQVDWLVACPRLEHAASYRNLFGFETLAEPRQYYGVRFQTELLAVRRTELHAYVSGRRGMVDAGKQALETLIFAHTQAAGPLETSS